MSVRMDEGVVRLEGRCGVEEAETLVGLLQGGASSVDISQCRHLHSAVAQALLAFRAPLVGKSPTPFLQDFVIPAMEVARSDTAERQPEDEAVKDQSASEADASPSQRS